MSISDLELLGCCPGLWWAMRVKPAQTGPQTVAAADVIAALRKWSAA